MGAQNYTLLSKLGFGDKDKAGGIHDKACRVAVTTFSISKEEEQALSNASIYWVKLGEDFDKYCAATNTIISTPGLTL